MNFDFNRKTFNFRGQNKTGKNNFIEVEYTVLDDSDEKIIFENNKLTAENKKVPKETASYSGFNRVAAFAFMIIFMLVCSCVFAEKYVFGGKKGWSEVKFREGITTGIGRFGNESLLLDSNINKPGENTDLLLTFEDGEIKDQSGKYKVVQNKLSITKKARNGKGAAISRSKGGGITLLGDSSSFFSSEGPAGSFTIDFWLCPSIVDNGEIIMNWRSSRNFNGDILYQLMTISFFKNKVMCVFSNIFDKNQSENSDIALVGIKKLIPEKWSHHYISFNEETGELSYKVDGELEDIKFITSNGCEGGTIYQAVLGVKAAVEICPEFMGKIDDFKISRTFGAFEAEKENLERAETLKPKKIAYSSGRFESEPIMTKAGSIMNSLTAFDYLPEQTGIQYYIRGGDNYFNWTENSPRWIPVKNGEKIENLTGLFFQIAADLFPSGDGEFSPSVTQIELDYTTLPEPQPPYKIKAESGDSSVTLSWTYSVDDTAGGYYIYYGNRPGEYLGRIANEGPSPINVGSVTSYTLTGLKNGTIYYFALSAWSKIDNRICGPLSKEVYARPSVK